jgi:transcriptional regulator with AAA-type ATPase domain
MALAVVRVRVRLSVPVASRRAWSVAAADAEPVIRRGDRLAGGPALVGSGPLWLRRCRQVEAAAASSEWLSLQGEPGTGKLALEEALAAGSTFCGFRSRSARDRPPATWPGW